MNELDIELIKVKFKCFGKIKFRQNSKHSKNLADLYKKKNKCDDANELGKLNENISEELEKERKESLSKEVSNLLKVKVKKGSAAAIFNLKQSIVGKKKNEQEVTTLIDPSNN